jgi:hypothetical protein
LPLLPLPRHASWYFRDAATWYAIHDTPILYAMPLYDYLIRWYYCHAPWYAACFHY